MPEISERIKPESILKTPRTVPFISLLLLSILGLVSCVDDNTNGLPPKNGTSLTEFVRNQTLTCSLSNGKKLIVSHYPDQTASIISNDMEMRAKYVVLEKTDYGILDYNIYEIGNMRDSSKTRPLKGNMGFYVLSQTGPNILVKTSKGGGQGKCVRGHDLTSESSDT